MIPFPDKKYQIIYADPPWKISNHKWDKWKSVVTEKYQLMDFENILNLPVKNISDINCGLFLWATHTYLEKAFEVIKSWGFKYHCCITWDKGGGWCLEGIYRRTEFCLYAYKGKMNINKTGKFISTLIAEPKRKHSQKPEIMYEIIESNTPEPRIELFARNKRDGWDCWGNEV